MEEFVLLGQISSLNEVGLEAKVGFEAIASCEGSGTLNFGEASFGLVFMCFELR